MQGEAQDIHKSGGAGMGQLFQDCVEEIQSLLCVLIFIPLCSLTSIAHFALLQHWTYQKKRSKMHPFMFLSSICSKQFQEVVQVLLVLASSPLREHFHGMGNRELPLPALMASEQACSVFLLPTAQGLSLTAFPISICSLFLCYFYFAAFLPLPFGFSS